ncbi:MAG TPA: ABC transporter ATP-binding protein [Deinococcales bacterium]|nr:ABC transporter ATP-binding protein [Deinococcales bacterium]
MPLELHRLSRSYPATQALADVTLSLPEGRVLGLLGPSGSGKSTLLRLVAGLEQPDGGSISLAGTDLTRVPARARNFGVVFQDFALFPHLDVRANIAFGLVERRWPKERRERRVAELLDLTGLAGFGGRRVQQLSGGQQQRVALARALAPEPRLLLLDEPFSNLDAALRETLTGEVADILSSARLTAVHVTHDRAEALKLADDLAILNGGRLVQHGAGSGVLAAPANAWTARFLGYRNVFETPQPVVLDDGLVSISETAGSGSPARVLEASAGGSRVELLLAVDGLAGPVSWHGHAREIPHVPEAGAELFVHIPDAAWLPLGRS